MAGQNLGMFWTKVGRAVLGQVNNLHTGNKKVVCKINCIVLLIYNTEAEKVAYMVFYAHFNY